MLEAKCRSVKKEKPTLLNSNDKSNKMRDEIEHWI